MGNKKKIARQKYQEKMKLANRLKGPIFGMTWGDILMPLAFFSAGLFLSVSSQYDAHIGYQTKNWPVTSGEVVSTQVVKYKSTSQSRASTSAKYRYALQVTYKYNVYGKDYTNNRIHIGERGTDAYDGAKPEEWGKKNYPAGGNIKVFYNPDSPEQAVLKLGVSDITYVLLAVSCLLIGIGYFFIRTLLDEKKVNRLSMLRRILESAGVILIFSAVNIFILPGGISDLF